MKRLEHEIATGKNDREQQSSPKQQVEERIVARTKELRDVPVLDVNRVGVASYPALGNLNRMPTDGYGRLKLLAAAQTTDRLTIHEHLARLGEKPKQDEPGPKRDAQNGRSRRPIGRYCSRITRPLRSNLCCQVRVRAARASVTHEKAATRHREWTSQTSSRGSVQRTPTTCGDRRRGIRN